MLPTFPRPTMGLPRTEAQVLEDINVRPGVNRIVGQYCRVSTYFVYQSVIGARVIPLSGGFL